MQESPIRMKPIDQIIVTCCLKDFWLTRICVASIRYWHPEVPIGLIKDTSGGDFSTEEMQAAWNVTLAAVPHPPRAMFSKLEAFHFPGRRRLLLLDSDIIFLGRVLDKLEAFDEDFVVNWGGKGPLNPATQRRYALGGYYNPDKLKAVLPDFEIPHFFFNSGHMVITSSLVERAMLSRWLAGAPPHEKVCDRELLVTYDQGLLNIVLVQMQREGRCSLALCDFTRWSRHPEILEAFSVGDLMSRRGHPFLIHWAEPKPFFKTGMVRSDLLGFYEDFYYSRIPQGQWKRSFRLLRRARSPKHLAPRLRAALKLNKLRIDLRQLLEQERNPGKEARVLPLTASGHHRLRVDSN